MAVQEFLRSVKIWQSYRQSSGPQFFLGHSVVKEVSIVLCVSLLLLAVHHIRLWNAHTAAY